MTRWAALIAALLAASPAGAQCLGFQCPPGVLGAGASGGGAPLDGFTTPSGAYSFRKLKSTYSGPAVRLRRASDNAELDINFLGCTGFTGCPWDEAAANAHCAATTCFVRTRYDQSGAARDIVQTTAANQPELVFSCSGSLPCMRTTASTQALSAASMTPATGVVSLSVVANRVTGTGFCAWFRENGNGNRISTTGGANTWNIQPSTAYTIAAADNAWHAGLGVVNGASSVIRIDATEVAGTATGTITAGAPGLVGGATTTCLWQEEVFWDNYVLTPAERLALQTNQKSYFGTP